jgi:hypothetical protein
MEHIIRERVYPPSEELTPSPKPPTYLRVALILLTAFSVMSLGARAVAQHTEPPPNPLASFADLLPGQPGSDLEGRGFSCYEEAYDYGAARDNCLIHLATGAFTRIGLLISKDRTIRQVTFSVRENTLRLGDLMLTLGRPEIHRYGHQMTFYWRSTGIAASTIVYNGQYSAFLPLWSISFASH